MKRVLAPTLMAMACCAAVAQSTPSTPSVTLYGIVDAGVTYTTGLASDKAAVVSGIMDGSRFGLRGNEDLGGGYRAIFTLENRTELNNGSGSSRPATGTPVPDRLNQAALLGLPAALQPAVNARRSADRLGHRRQPRQQLLGPAGLGRAGHTVRRGARRASIHTRVRDQRHFRYAGHAVELCSSGRSARFPRPSTSASAMRCSTASSWAG